MDKTTKYLYHQLVVLTIVVLFGGTIFYHLIEKWSILNSYYFCVVTLTTVGYGDYTPTTPAGKLFTTFYILVGISIIGAFINAFVKRRGMKMHARAEAKSQRNNQSSKPE